MLTHWHAVRVQGHYHAPLERAEALRAAHGGSIQSRPLLIGEFSEGDERLYPTPLPRVGDTMDDLLERARVAEAATRPYDWETIDVANDAAHLHLGLRIRFAFDLLVPRSFGGTVDLVPAIGYAAWYLMAEDAPDNPVAPIEWALPVETRWWLPDARPESPRERQARAQGALLWSGPPRGPVEEPLYAALRRGWRGAAGAGAESAAATSARPLRDRSDELL